MRRSPLIALCLVLLAGCATFERVRTPVKYTLLGEDRKLRGSLEAGLAALKEERYEEAVAALNRSVWELEGISSRGLRVEELAETHRALGSAYSGLRKRDWAEEQWQLAQALRGVGKEAEGSPGSPDASLSRAKEAYASARFPQALTTLRQALIDLEGVTDPPTRVKRLEEARCYLVFTYVALEKETRAKAELQRLQALDSSVASCAREAPPVVRRLISEVQKRPAAR
jgi:tetratricopeptide (TPR) repeat protein